MARVARYLRRLPDIIRPTYSVSGVRRGACGARQMAKNSVINLSLVFITLKSLMTWYRFTLVLLQRCLLSVNFLRANGICELSGTWKVNFGRRFVFFVRKFWQLATLLMALNVLHQLDLSTRSLVVVLVSGTFEASNLCTDAAMPQKIFCTSRLLPAKIKLVWFSWRWCVLFLCA